MRSPDDVIPEAVQLAAAQSLSPVTFLLECMPRTGLASGFLRVPLFLLHGEILGWLERIHRGLATVFLVCLRYADRQDHLISASQATLSRECGIADPRTLAARLHLLQRGQKAAGLPPLLRKLPGKGIRYEFRQDGLQALVGLAQRSLKAREEKLAAIRRAQSAGGKRGMASRWGAR
jgi:hypothetical protein